MPTISFGLLDDDLKSSETVINLTPLNILIFCSASSKCTSNNASIKLELYCDLQTTFKISVSNNIVERVLPVLKN